MKIAEPIESADHEREQGEEPAKQQAAGVVVADMFQPLVGFAVVETLVLDFPTTLGHAIYSQADDFAFGEVGEPVRLDHGAIRFMLPVA